MATFELWNTESRNLLGSFATEELALAAVREAIQRNGEEYGQILALGREDSRGNSRIVARGHQLVERVVQPDQQPGQNRHPGPASLERRRSG